MNYILAKELKDAGFPQKRIEQDLWLNSEGKSHYADKDIERLKEPDEKTSKEMIWVYAPTLEELIEACGESLGDLTRAGKGWMTNYDNVGNYPQSEGDTPNEAVARLWLALNKK